MIPVETYITVEKKDLQEALSTRHFLPFQGENVLFRQGAYSEEDVKIFLGEVFTRIGKIAAIDKDGKYHLVSDKFHPVVVEPFMEYEDNTETFSNNISRIAKFIGFGYKTYEV